MTAHPDSYTVEQHEHGVVITGRIPVTSFDALGAMLADAELTLFDTAIAKKLGATLVATTEVGSRARRLELGIEGQGE
jgi:hypothetical protein